MNKKVVIGFVIGLGVIITLVVLSSLPPKLSEDVGDNQNNQSVVPNQQMQSFSNPCDTTLPDLH